MTITPPVYEIVDENRQRIVQTAAAHGATHVRLIGTVSRSDGSFEDDIGLLVRWREGTSLPDQEALRMELEGLLGRDVDIASHDGSAVDMAGHDEYEDGMVIAYYRDFVRHRILRTVPITGTTDPTCELHVMTCRHDWLNLIWTLKSFYHFSQRRYALCIHDDGSLPALAIEQLRRLFPDARLIPRGNADASAEGTCSRQRFLIFPRFWKTIGCCCLTATCFILQRAHGFA